MYNIKCGDSWVPWVMVRGWGSGTGSLMGPSDGDDGDWLGDLLLAPDALRPLPIR